MVKQLTILFALLSFSLLVQGQDKNKFQIPSGLYATYYPEFINDTSYRPGYNIIYPDNTGQYWSGDICDLELEKYHMQIDGDILILYNYLIYTQNCDFIGNFEEGASYKQYFKIIDISDSMITMKFGDIIYDGTEVDSLTFTDDIYIWKRLGNYY